jgi:hypothetical protein
LLQSDDTLIPLLGVPGFQGYGANVRCVAKRRQGRARILQVNAVPSERWLFWDY